jgi:hypothetical protein
MSQVLIRQDVSPRRAGQDNIVTSEAELPLICSLVGGSASLVGL